MKISSMPMRMVVLKIVVESVSLIEVKHDIVINRKDKTSGILTRRNLVLKN